MDLAEQNDRSQNLILGLALALVGFGLIMVYSAVGGSTTDVAVADRALVVHGVHVAIGLAVLVVLCLADYHWLERLALPLLVLNVVMLVSVYCFPAIKGAHRWIVISDRVRFQPSELTKLALVLYLARYMTQHGEEAGSFRKGFMFPTVIVGCACALIFFERDLGTSVVVAGVAYLVMICAGTSVLYVSGLACVSMPLLLASVRRSHYQWQRIVTFLDPWAYADTTGYHCIQSLISLGSGGWLGFGLGNGQHKLLFVPETRADSVLCVVGEELGFAGTTLVVVAFILLVREGIRIALRAPDTFGSLVAFGLTITLGLQAAVNVAVVTVSVPTKGIPLPFVSAGGSSLVLSMASLGILMNIAKQGVRIDTADLPGEVPAAAELALAPAPLGILPGPANS